MGWTLTCCDRTSPFWWLSRYSIVALKEECRENIKLSPSWVMFRLNLEDLVPTGSFPTITIPFNAVQRASFEQKCWQTWLRRNFIPFPRSVYRSNMEFRDETYRNPRSSKCRCVVASFWSRIAGLKRGEIIKTCKFIKILTKHFVTLREL